MTFLLIIADDFTGALDTGVQFSAHGVQTQVVVGADIDLYDYQASVLVVDTETRHLPASEAYRIVARLTRLAISAKVQYIYKKTDSALRGNIGAELAAVLEGSESRRIAFQPAFPQTGRTTIAGIQCVDGIPVTESPFGKDPFDPVKHSVVVDLIAEQTDISARCYPPLKENQSVPDDGGILVFDAETFDDLYQTGCELVRKGDFHIMAGCAGFAAVLPELLDIPTGNSPEIPILDPRLLVICGSVNPITQRQLDIAGGQGFERLQLLPEQKLDPGYWDSYDSRIQMNYIMNLLDDEPYCIIETNDPYDSESSIDYASDHGISRETMRIQIAESLGKVLDIILNEGYQGTLLVTGGDTLLQCMNCIGVKELEPVCELKEGVVLAGFTYHGAKRYLISKSGGFGDEMLLIDIAVFLARQERRR